MPEVESHMPHRITAAIARAQSLLLTAPLDLDGDAVGSVVALDRAIRWRWPQKSVRVVVDEVLPARYRFMRGAEARFERARDVPVAPVDLAIVFDGDPGRLGAVTPHYEAARVRGQVDHHKSSDPGAVDVSLLDPRAASTTELVLQLCDRWGVPLDADIATAIYAGLVFDTHVFRYRLTRPQTLRAAARLMETGIDHSVIVEQVLLDQPLAKQRLRGEMLGGMTLDLDGQLAWAVLDEDATQGVETGGLVDDLVFIEGVEVAALLLTRADGALKLSLRSRGGVDVCAVARSLNPQGGGHARAAGATLRADTRSAVASVIATVRAALLAR